MIYNLLNDYKFFIVSIKLQKNHIIIICHMIINTTINLIVHKYYIIIISVILNFLFIINNL